mmetsp:Transcript_34435/g.98384  ORF Transcript_34435/g.98384 Transcript_34435/m.98384 type:complete len:218 (+) Transcript_34435:410-1063(+)
MPAAVTRTQKSAISCGSSWSTVTPVSFHAKLASQEAKAAPMMMPSARLWKKSPKRTGPPILTAERLLFEPSMACSSSDLSASGKRIWQKCSTSKPRNQPSRRKVPQVQVPVTSSWPAPARCRPSGSIRKAAADASTPEAKELANGARLSMASRNFVTRAKATRKIPTSVGAMVSKEAATTSPHLSFELACELPDVEEQLLTDSCRTGSTFAPVDVRR